MFCFKNILSKAGAAGGMDLSAFMPAPDLERGQPATLMQTRHPFTGLQEGAKSANFDGNPHWNDVLIYRADGSSIHFSGIDFSVINKHEETFFQVDSEYVYNIICWKRCCPKKGKGRLSTTTTWQSHDGAHEIRMVHKDGLDPEVNSASKALLAMCFPFTCLCISTTVCKSCCVSKTEGIKYSVMEPETFQLFYDKKPVGSVKVMPGLEKVGKEPEIIKQTTALTPEGQQLWVMNDTNVLQDVGGEREVKTYHCCAGDSGLCDQCVPCCCPVCLPMGSYVNCPSCLKCCFPLFKCCGCMCQCGIKCCVTECYCFKCCGMCCKKCCPTCDGPCCACGVRQLITEQSYRQMPVDNVHKVHRILYPLHKDVKNYALRQDDMVAGWAAYTFMDVPGWPSHASFTKPEGPVSAKGGGGMRSRRLKRGGSTTPTSGGAGEEEATLNVLDLLALPLLVDLSMGTENKMRDQWTFAGSEHFYPLEVVNYWPPPQVLDSVFFNMNRGTLHNGEPGLNAIPPLCPEEPKPVQQSMSTPAVVGKQNTTMVPAPPPGPVTE